MMESTLDYDALSARECPDAVIVLRPHGEVLHWNAGAEEVFGYAIAEAIGQRLHDLIVTADQGDGEDRLCAEALANGFSTAVSLRRRKDGTLVYVDITNKVVRGPGRPAPLILSTKKDVTHLRVMRDTKQVEARFRDLGVTIAIDGFGTGR
jgi:PAS domain S-box-containing protein